MFTKIMLVTLSAIVLGGCSINWRALMGEGAVTDQQANVAATPGPSVDPVLEAMPSPGTGSDVTSLETDINSTVILDEDFSDLN